MQVEDTQNSARTAPRALAMAAALGALLVVPAMLALVGTPPGAALLRPALRCRAGARPRAAAGPPPDYADPSAAMRPPAELLPSLFPPAARRRSLDHELGAIAVPSLAALSCENLLSLVDTLYIGRLGAAQLGAAGVGIAATYSFAKLFGDPLTKTSTSLVAGREGDALLSSVLAALALALSLGLAQSTVFLLFAPRIVAGFGAAPGSPLAGPAADYLRFRSLGAPAVTLLLVMQGIFRGLGDTLTPLLCTLAGAAVNAVLDPIFIFRCGLGCGGAAAATAVANYVSAVPLLILLLRRLSATGENDDGLQAALENSGRGGLSRQPARRRKLVLPPAASLRAAAAGYAAAGGTIYLRTVGKLWGYSFAARRAASLGPIPAAAYALTFQLGVATTQLCEAVSLAMQALLSRELNRNAALQAGRGGGSAGVVGAGGEAGSMAGAETGGRGPPSPPESEAEAEATACRASARYVLRRGLLLGGGLASALSVVTWACRAAAVGALTSSPEVRAAAVGVMPLVLVTQVIKGLAYPANAVLMGGSDWLASTLAMWASSAVLVHLLSRSAFGTGLHAVWGSLAACFAMQVVTALGRVASRTGPWRVLRRRSV
jgi:Na+-driven multidrug efflux pump